MSCGCLAGCRFLSVLEILYFFMKKKLTVLFPCYIKQIYVSTKHWCYFIILSTSVKDGAGYLKLLQTIQHIVTRVSKQSL